MLADDVFLACVHEYLHRHRNGLAATEDLVRATGGLVGTPDEIIAMLREREAMGLNEITLLPAMATARRNLKDFSEQVIARY